MREERPSYWVVLDPIADREVKLVLALSREGALAVAADGWGYTTSEMSARKEFLSEAMATRLTKDQAREIGLRPPRSEPMDHGPVP